MKKYETGKNKFNKTKHKLKWLECGGGNGANASCRMLGLQNGERLKALEHFWTKFIGAK